MSVSKQHTKITRQVDTKHLEELATQSIQDPRPTSKMHKDELLGLLGKAGGVALPVQEVGDDDKTHRLEVAPVRNLAAGSQEIRPPSLDPVEAPREPDAAAQSSAPLPAEQLPAPSPLVEPAPPVLSAAPSDVRLRFLISLLVLTFVASVGFLGFQLAT